MAKDLELIVHRKTIELQHDRGIKRGDVAMPDVARHAGEKDVGVAAFEAAHHRHLGNGMALAEIFAEKERVDPGGVAAHDHVLVVVGKNLRLDEIARAQEIGDRARFAHRAKSALAITLGSSCQARCSSLPESCEISAAFVRPKCCATSLRSKPDKRAHPDIVKLREEKCVDEMPAFDRELRIIDRLLRDLETRRPRTEKSAAPAPVEFRFRLPRARDEKWQIESEEVMAFDHVRIALLDQTR